MAPNPEALRDVLRKHKIGVLATIRKDGRPQLSTVMYHYDPETNLIRVSVTDNRAKTRNVIRDPRAVMHVRGASDWEYAVADGAVTLSPVTEVPGDAGSDELVDLYRTIAGKDHPDWDEYRRAMADEHRRVLKLSVDHLYGMAK
ncbi:PPOX class F420-dependent oxidoreductase [Granulicoccus phenolivorans]|uniref:PPOX class F420-dependent oxidoreductase n=1 Tax=Granulicoccus phenolivorans TaxID=266854 RepID=UPI0003F6853C|nr:PPOX class F420-dependent oxidoreductase [Granulicoccus phenolivorans]